MFNDDVLEDTICNKCAYCVRRLIVPLFPEDWIPSFEEQIDEEESTTEEVVTVEHTFCNKLNLDLIDHTVLECSLYTPKQEPNYFIKHLRVLNM